MKSKKRFYLNLLALLFVSSFITSCVSSKKINYLQNENNESMNNEIISHEPPLQVADMLNINVAAVDYEASLPFNLFQIQTINQQVPLPYLIDVDGYINFPVLGRIKAAQLTTKELTAYLTERLEPYLKKPIVNIRLTNFKVNILGEVKNPGSYQVLNERISILEAIGLAGDLTVYADREDITLVREQDGERTFKTIDLTSKTLFDSPYFYLSQNDAIYIPANKTKVNSSGVGPNTSIIISALSVLLTLVAILVR